MSIESDTIGSIFGKDEICICLEFVVFITFLEKGGCNNSSLSSLVNNDVIL
jgi:hypothetical protein